MKWLKSLLPVAFALALLYFAWNWGFCRFYVEPGYMAVITSKIGKPLPPGQILAQKGQKGIREDVLGEGRHFLNPVFYDWTIMPYVLIPPGEIGVVTSKVGQELPEGEFLANDGEKGIWRKVLGPGIYRINPYGYTIEIEDRTALSIPIGYCGVITSLSGSQAEEGQFAKLGQKGVMQDILQPGLYYVNPREYKVDILEVGVNQVSLLGKDGGEVITKGQMQTQNAPMEKLQSKVLEEQQKKRVDYFKKSSDMFSRRSGQPQPTKPKQAYKPADPRQEGAKAMERMKKEYVLGDSMASMGLAQYVEFPSRDGFSISLDMTVEFELLPNNVAMIYLKYGDLPAVVDKIIMPQITSISRNKGSEYGAQDFIVGEGREKFQDDLTQALAKTLGEKGIIVHNALIRHVEVPMQILEPIQDASVAVEEDLTNQEKQNTAKKQAELNTELALIEQKREEVLEGTKKITAEINAELEKDVARIHAETIQKAAEIEKKTKKVEADTVRILSKAKADATLMVGGETASGLQLKSTSFNDPRAFPLWEFANQLNEEVRINILHAGEGTLWTDLENAGMAELGGAQTLKGASKKE